MEKDSILKKCTELEQQGKYPELLTFIEQCVSDTCNDPDIIYFYGKILKKFNRFGDALNAFNRALALDPEHKFSKAGIAIINSILSIENTFYYENAYTDDALYEE